MLRALAGKVGLLRCANPRREQLLEHDRVGRCSVGDDLQRRDLRRADGLVEEPVSRHSVTPRGDQHINDLPELVDRSVHVPPSPGNFRVGLVHELAIAYSVPAGAGGLGQQRREPLYPAVDGDVISLDTTLGEEFPDVAIRQRAA
jgi:hypothetical protein